MRPNHLVCSLVLVVTLLSLPAQMYASCPNEYYCPDTGNGSTSWIPLPGYECWEKSQCVDSAFFQRDCKVVTYYRESPTETGTVVDFKDCYRGCTCIIVEPWV